MFSVVIPTLGRPTLLPTLDSIPEDVQRIVVVDTFEMDDDTRAGIRHLTTALGVTHLELDAGRHDTGSSQLALGFAEARGQWLLNFGDDDVYEPGAFDIIRQAIAEQRTPHPLMFKVELLPNGARGNRRPVTLWQDRSIRRYGVTGQSFVCPNDPAKLGRWVDDVTFMQGTVALHGHQIDWREERIARCY
jgi:hypothetical protein